MSGRRGRKPENARREKDAVRKFLYVRGLEQSIALGGAAGAAAAAELLDFWRRGENDFNRAFIEATEAAQAARAQANLLEREKRNQYNKIVANMGGLPGYNNNNNNNNNNNRRNSKRSRLPNWGGSGVVENVGGAAAESGGGGGGGGGASSARAAGIRSLSEEASRASGKYNPRSGSMASMYGSSLPDMVGASHDVAAAALNAIPEENAAALNAAAAAEAAPRRATKRRRNNNNTRRGAGGAAAAVAAPGGGGGGAAASIKKSYPPMTQIRINGGISLMESLTKGNHFPELNNLANYTEEELFQITPGQLNQLKSKARELLLTPRSAEVKAALRRFIAMELP